MAQFQRVDEQGKPVFRRVTETGTPGTADFTDSAASRPNVQQQNLMQSRRQASTAEFENNQPPDNFLSRWREAKIAVTEPFALQTLVPMAKSVTSAGKDMLTGEGTAKAQQLIGGMARSMVEPPINWAKDVAKGDYNAASYDAGQILTNTVPAVVGGVETLKSAPAALRRTGNAITTPDALLQRATDLKAKMAAPSSSSIPLSKTAIAKTAIQGVADVTRKPRVGLYKGLANQLAKDPGYQAGQAAAEAQYQSAREQQSNVDFNRKPWESPWPVRSNPIPRPPALSLTAEELRKPAHNADFRLPERHGEPIEFPNAPPPALRGPQFDYRRPSTPSEPIPFEPPESWNEPLPKTGAALTAPDINRWMGVAWQDVMHGADPGARILSENLLSNEGKVATHANVKTALVDAGKQMDAHLKAAGDKGIAIDAREATTTSHPKIVEIKAKYPSLDKLSPTETHRLKTEIGNEIDWSQNGYADLPNREMVRIYRNLNSSIKTAIPDIGPTQARWADLFISSKSLARAVAKNIVGGGTPDKPVIKPPKALQAKPNIKEDMKTKRFPLPL